ncbi:hypothetical protein [Streptomyces olivochromogenes]|uniref:hypothetical protein n=1 Tax=Streptomyces olivochromogenes TaxID=1963 RepID=UPI001F2DFC52|nr:hypothetical protein [Streptomyces olivochromogenes]MCF3137390.1 hypothetical protein [Streptomyces olivochromogenes]
MQRARHVPLDTVTDRVTRPRRRPLRLLREGADHGPLPTVELPRLRTGQVLVRLPQPLAEPQQRLHFL